MTVDWAATFLVMMYVISGARKVCSLGASEAARFAARTGLRATVSQAVVLAAGAWELVGAFLVLYGVWMQTGGAALRSVQRGTTLLAVFTVLATVIFYMRPFRYQPFLANLTALSGLALLPKVCELRR